MPPLKEYIFENELNSNIKLSVKAYSYEDAMELMVSIAKHPSDFILIEQ